LASRVASAVEFWPPGSIGSKKEMKKEGN
jgi:hypothetical protein